MADSMDNDEPLHRLEALLDTVSQVGASAPGGDGLRAVRGAAGATRKWFGAARVAGSQTAQAARSCASVRAKQAQRVKAQQETCGEIWEWLGKHWDVLLGECGLSLPRARGP